MHARPWADLPPSQADPEAQVYGEQPSGDIQMMPEGRHLSGFEVLTVTAGQVKGEMTMGFLVPPVLIRKVGKVLEKAIGVDGAALPAR